MKPVADRLQALSLEYLLKTKELTHLRVRRHGVLLVLESGPDDDPIPHARFRRLGAHIWRLEMATHNDGWETTPLRGQIDKLLDFLRPAVLEATTGPNSSSIPYRRLLLQ